ATGPRQTRHLPRRRPTPLQLPPAHRHGPRQPRPLHRQAPLPNSRRRPPPPRPTPSAHPTPNAPPPPPDPPPLAPRPARAPPPRPHPRQSLDLVLRQILHRLRIPQRQLLHLPHDHVRDRPIPEPLPVRRDHVPRRVRRRATRQRVVERVHVVIPPLPLNQVPG